MSIELLEANAMLGDVDAMMQLARHYVDAKKFTAAVEWYDRAAGEGNQNAMYRSTLIHALFMQAHQKDGDWAELGEHAAVVRKHTAELISQHRNRTFVIKEDVLDELYDHFRDGLYFGAVSIFYQNNERNKPRGVELLDGLSTTRERTLLMLLMLEADDNRWDIADLAACLNDRQYAAAEKCSCEQHIYALAIIVVAGQYRRDGSLDRAVALLDRGLSLLNDEDAISTLRDERVKYSKRLFGGWRYDG